MDTKNGTSRRRFLQELTVVGAAVTLAPTGSKAAGSEKEVQYGHWGALPTRTLGSKKAAFTVSALGLGVMGMTYNRSEHPDTGSIVYVFCMKP